MQILKPINIGLAPNDQTGDTLRDAMALVNENFAKTRVGVETVEVSAAAAQRKADTAVPMSEKGVAGGVTPLDAVGKVPAAHLPPPAIPLSQKSAPSGVAPLGEDGRVPVEHLPIPVPSVPLAEKGKPNGVATLGGNGKVAPAQLPALIPLAEKAQPDGVATLGADGLIVANQLPPLVPASDKGRPGGVATLGADGRVPAVQLSAVPPAEKGQPGGIATLDDGGKVPVDQLPPIPSGPPVGSVAWWPLRTSIPAGQIPADGQIISRATFKDLAAMVAARSLPVVQEAEWLADPLKRGSFTLGDGSTTIRMPDYNGKSPGSIGAPFMRGDGALLNGVLKASQNKAHQHVFSSPHYLYGETGGSSSFYGTTASVTPIFTRNTTSEGGAEAHPTFASGVWTVQAFGTVTNAGSVDAAQLASDLGVAQSTLQQLKGQVFGTGQQLRSRTTVLRTWYQNTTGRPILVGFHCVGVAAGTIIVAGYLNNVSGNAGSVPYHYDTTPGGYAGMRCGFTMHVPPGMWWMADTINANVESGSIWEYA
ncbi:phage tail protein [Achromobacter xylosoxidans]|uniref:phage tail protein n=1 Tax=Alcaligenes xylosoxydans xylosoxydans TaxID=85698 RepID=UPI001232016F|nr:phage tail protein [Achromobacter xylosoxidans]KAA5920415.1 phage tail protein [Achromobacter xylosoxidans]